MLVKNHSTLLPNQTYLTKRTTNEFEALGISFNARTHWCNQTQKVMLIFLMLILLH